MDRSNRRQSSGQRNDRIPDPTDSDLQRLVFCQNRRQI
jgi:hypothetical protein